MLEPISQPLKSAFYNPPEIERNLIGPSGKFVGSVEFSTKENHRARQRTLPTDPLPGIALVGRRG